MLLSLLIITWHAGSAMQLGTSIDHHGSNRHQTDASMKRLSTTDSEDGTTCDTFDHVPPQSALCDAFHSSPEPLMAKSILFLGGSLDNNAVTTFCHCLNATVYGDPYKGQYCRVGKSGNSTVAMMLHPGSGEKPYFSEYNQTTSTDQLIRQYAPNFTRQVIKKRQVINKEVSEPDLVVVDDSLWLVSKWWEHNGSPQGAPFPVKEVNQWCTTDLRWLMQLVQDSYQKSRIAFRTAPTVLGRTSGQTPEVFEGMATCVKAQTYDELLFGRFDLVDYHQLVDDMISSYKEKGHSPESLYKNENHPGSELDLAYFGILLKVLKESSVLEDELQPPSERQRRSSDGSESSAVETVEDEQRRLGVAGSGG
eukprot:gnl/TRDRNA2_/TRDRNA2_38463_c0_seq1.p1 gnl/TRDRNA2_/TRDRNA2_38463_c0~~gnl/TRDRNA2_/TRDRNA2_38463_c0_seq1.p1  ORF type:complete len:365 (+),score=30.55 gnl/TRDRNA2_/TRDRNA2_38463_c0_seq1:80-1174(+)